MSCLHYFGTSLVCTGTLDTWFQHMQKKKVFKHNSLFAINLGSIRYSLFCLTNHYQMYFCILSYLDQKVYTFILNFGDFYFFFNPYFYWISIFHLWLFIFSSSEPKHSWPKDFPSYLYKRCGPKTNGDNEESIKKSSGCWNILLSEKKGEAWEIRETSISWQ